MESTEAVLTVEDRGVGISHDDLQNLFLPFRRGRPTLAPGSGLGLSTVRHIVLAHGGTITAEPRDGGGACFRVRLPRWRAPREIEAPLPDTGSSQRLDEARPTPAP